MTDAGVGSPPSPIDELRRKLGATWEAITIAREAAVAKRRELEKLLAPLASPDTSIVVFGSLARQEFTVGSDIDWTLLIDGSTDPGHLDTSLEITDRLESIGQKPPGREGTFGGMTSSFDLVHKIGGGDGTNRNTTQRILLLLESTVVGSPDAYDRVLRNVLRRYILEDYGWLHSSVSVPRFLQNDIARYWRTVAVDFAYKRRHRRGDGWALRTAKLRLSRKLTYVSGLLACFSCATDPVLRHTRRESEADLTHPVVEHLWTLARRTPLEVIAGELIQYDQLRDPVRGLFDSYDAFLALLNDRAKREHLDNVEKDDVAQDSVYEEVRTLGHRFQEALTAIFLEKNGTPLYDLTKAYGVF